MKEELLHYVWRLRKFDHTDLQTTEGLPVEILHPGEHNHNAGPDFLNARIRIGDTLWAGNVEMHLRASDWNRHGHSEDPAYRNVILHVVLDADVPILHPENRRLPCLTLKKRIPARLDKVYRKLLHNEYWIPCQHLFHQAPELTRRLWLDRLLVERLESRIQAMRELLQKNKNDWEATGYQLLIRSFGLNVNGVAFERLAASIPHRLLLRHRDRLFQIEALLFGQSGLLEHDYTDEYPRKLQQEYDFLRKKYGLQPIEPALWKFSRMRPANFPTIRIAQLATLFYQSAHLFGKILAAQSITEVEHMFTLKLSNYWQDHYTFDRASARRHKTLGQSTIHLLVINTIAPLLFLYGKEKGDEQFKDRALRFMEDLKPEKNTTIDQWKQLGWRPESAYQTQALLQLKKYYCDEKKCLQCAIGHTILSTSKERSVSNAD